VQDENIKYRIRRARETLNDAELLFDNGSINSCINRLYYAAFYATIALLLDSNIEVKSHNGVKQKLGEEFVLKGTISREFAKIYSVLSDYRHKGDYDDLFEFDQEIVGGLLEPVREYIDYIDGLLSQ
jgi:uncharacterized protein (UPF0332 family)